MKQGKLTILMVAVVAIGIFALPSIMSAGTGQHAFVNGSTIRTSTSDSENCNKCHGLGSDDVSGELKSSDMNMFYNLTGPGNYTIHSSIQCAHCHKEAVAGAGLDTHTKVTAKPLCKDCHSSPGVVSNTKVPGGTVYLQDVWTELSNVSEAHRGFAYNATAGAAVDASIANAGCLGCHTGVSVSGEISYTYSAGVQSEVGLFVGETGTSNPTPTT